MVEILSQAEIDALLNALDTGALDAEVIKQEESEKRIKEYDFRRPDKFSKEQLNTIKVIMENFARILTTYLSGQLRSRVHVEVSSVDQLTYEEFVRSVPSPTIISIFDMYPLEGKSIMEINPHIAFYIIDKLFGGPGNKNFDVRTLTEIESLIISKLVSEILVYLKEAWENIVETEPEMEALESNPSFVQIVSPTEMVIILTLNVQIGEIEGLMNFCIPCLTLEPISNRLNVQYWYGSTAKEQTAENLQLIKRKINRAEVEVNAVLGNSEISLRDLLDLQVGDVVALTKKVEEEIDVLVGSQPKFKGKPGMTENNRLAVQITEVIETSEEGENE